MAEEPVLRDGESATTVSKLVQTKSVYMSGRTQDEYGKCLSEKRYSIER
jgi:hypothetical protein